MELKILNTLIDLAKQKPTKRIAVAAADDEPVLKAVAEARAQGIAEPILVGRIAKIKEISEQIGFDLTDVEILDEANPSMSCKRAVQLVRDNKAHILMKGLVSTADYLRAVLDKEKGLRTGNLLSHIGFFEVPAYHKVIGLTDAAQNIAPTFEEKVGILKNSIDLYHRLGMSNPKIAVLAPVETVNTKMESTIHAAMLTQMNRRGQIPGCIIDGPLAFDNAVSLEAAHHKGITSEVSGDVDLLLVPSIETGNVLYKCFTYFSGATVAAIILGAKVPIVLTSRADTDRSKLLSITLAANY
jgi:phosphate butyryltransferase